MEERISAVLNYPGMQKVKYKTGYIYFHEEVIAKFERALKCPVNESDIDKLIEYCSDDDGSVSVNYMEDVMLEYTIRRQAEKAKRDLERIRG